MSGFYLLVFLAFGMLVPYLNLHYHRLGVTATQLGLITGTATVIGLFLQPLWGYLADRSTQRARFLARLALMLGVMALVVSRMTAVYTVMAAGIAFLMVQNAILPVSDSLALAEAARTGRHFSRLRVWGAVGWIISTAASGWIYDLTGNSLMFLWFSAGMALCAAWTWRLGGESVSAAPRMSFREAIRTIGSTWRLAAILAVACLVQAGLAVHMLFMPIYLAEQGAPDSYVGLAFSIGALAEVPIFLTIAHVARRTGPFPLLVAAVISQGALFGLMSLSPAPAYMLAINALSGVFFAISQPTLITLVSELTPEGLKATGQGVLHSATWGVGNMLGTMVGGRVVDLIGIPALYGYLVFVSAAGVIAYSVMGLTMRRGAAPGLSG